jgi:glyoxylase-like metal-dependent hydrolase (beta-lactamase superfamily II)
VVRGADGLLVVDTRESHARARELLDEVRRLSPLPVRWVVNTHWHFDHTFGNAVLAGAPDRAALWGHVTVPAALERDGPGRLERLAAERPEEAAEVELTPPDHLVEVADVIDLGDRLVELVHLGRGHTDGDLVVLVQDAGVLFAGDLVEESAPPAFGGDSFPLEWPRTARLLLDLAPPVVVPGHGDVVDHRFCAEQHEALGVVAATIRELHGAGVPLDDAATAGEDRWPWPAAALRQAIARGYAALAG